VKLRSILEDQDRHVAFCFGRMNPPTIGHKAVFETLRKQGGDYRIFLSKTQDRKKNPLDYATKIDFIKRIHPEHADKIVEDASIRTPLDAATYLYDQGYTHVTFVAGDDRKNMFDLIKKYNGVDGKEYGYYKFETIDFVSAGAREDEADGIASISATLARKAAAAGDIEAFAKATGAGDVAEDLYQAVRAGLNIDETVSQENLGNPVAKNLNKFNKPQTHKDRKKSQKRGDEKHKGNKMRGAELYNENDNSKRLAELGRILMNKAVEQKDDTMSQTMSVVGSELTGYGEPSGANSIEELEKRTGMPRKIILQLMNYASNFKDTTASKVKDPEPDTNGDEDDDFREQVNLPGASAAKYGSKVLSTLESIVDRSQAMTVDFQDGKGKVDAYTASAIMQVYDSVNNENKSKLKDVLSTKTGFMKMAKFAMQQVK